MHNSKVPAGIVSALGLTQIIGYGTLYYSFSILAPGMAKDLGLTLAEIFGIFSASLLIGGLSAMYIGKQMDHIGAATVMTVGSALAAFTLAICAWSPSVAVFAFAIILLEISSGMVQYQAAFATLVESEPRSASRSITYLTLIGGFASTIFWPISAALAAYLSWREIYLVFAGLNLFLCMPLHYWIMRVAKTGVNADSTIRTRETVIGTLPAHARRRSMMLVSFAFAMLGFTLSAMLAHMVPMLGSIGLGAAAVVIGSLFGPAQVLSRLINMVFGKSLLPPALAALSAILIVAGVFILMMTGDWLPGAVAFAICLGLGSGINSIAQGSLPLYLFGSDGYGAITGKMVAARLAVSAAAPFVFAAAMENVGISFALAANACLGAISIAAFVAVATSSRQPATATA
ncbi:MULTISPECIES: arsenite efflux MFS transporter ArsK [unclassified Agrobacterium]|uniref:arsenite efflux MFS transporter ArsK n=1 Tax=unclassified Agrobacterium TaxID=2632611 RepID=UPI00244CC326|nr:MULTISPECIES: arsenite efflux MFS transporter ArsK [unclassified Agrobacterium]MDH0614123.1 arsenite efflux MFS transporter ArsK [Agrobacterium sp. GD03872]MDH0695582.1 arsenite efflux MFS transporter ArsK [Agrobacterium sp. GD03871]MDH1058484.1 arsenite efflux MFS transporter ArsK [Agrobacterium sp. GD03992]MDH2209574.1 arsenite efflux MFS transporter ArsK [Agrobacterium sp. GD03643]MDH2218978.1 arsenite efflux MFS transporter ArsK [Agrobacterium sp. GD03638]